MAYILVWQEKASYVATNFSELLTLCSPPPCQRKIFKPDQLCDLLYSKSPKATRRWRHEGTGKSVKLAFHEIALTAETWIKHPKIFAALALSDFHMGSLWQDRNLKHGPRSHRAERCPWPAQTRSWFQCTPTQMLPRPCQGKSNSWQMLSGTRHWEEGRGVSQGKIFLCPFISSCQWYYFLQNRDCLKPYKKRITTRARSAETLWKNAMQFEKNWLFFRTFFQVSSTQLKVATSQLMHL